LYAVANKNVRSNRFRAIYLEIEKIKGKESAKRNFRKSKPKLMEFYNQVETINGKSNNIGT
jgi:hypothetical protein